MQIDKEAITRPPEKPLKHPIRKLVISFILATVLMFFMGTISLDQYSGYLHPPTFPLSYIVTTPCLNILGYCIGSYSYSLARAVVDFALWYAAGSLGIFALIALLTANNSLHLSNKITVPKRRANLLGFLLVVVILFAIFVPVVPMNLVNSSPNVVVLRLTSIVLQ